MCPHLTNKVIQNVEFSIHKKILFHYNGGQCVHCGRLRVMERARSKITKKSGHKGSRTNGLFTSKENGRGGWTEDRTGSSTRNGKIY